MSTATKHRARSRKSHHRTEAIKAHTFAEMSRYNLQRHYMRKESGIGAMIAGMLPLKKKEA